LSSAGTSGTANTTTTALDSLIFSAGTDATSAYTVTVNGTQNAQLLTIEEGAPTFSAGTIALGTGSGTAGGGLTVAAGAGNPTISSNLSLTGRQTFNVGSGRTLALNTGTFTRATGATLNVQGAGTVTSTMTGLAANTVGIVGPWASIGTGTATQYATFTGSTIGAFTGTAAANPVALTDTTGLLNYDLATGSGNVQNTFSAHTIRLTGASGSMVGGAGSFSVNGLMNAGTSPGVAWNIVTSTLTIGGNRELVLNAASGPIAIGSVIRDNGGGASGLTITGTSVSLSGANTYTGRTTINGTSVTLGNGTTVGSLSPSSAIVNNGVLSFFHSNTVTQGTAFASVISGTGQVGQSGSGTTVLNGTNTFTGALSAQAGVLSINTIGNSGVAGNAGAGSTLLFAGGTLRYTGATTSTNRTVSTAPSTFSFIDITNAASNLTFAGFNAPGTGGITKRGEGMLTIASALIHTGATAITAGTLALATGGAIADTSNLTVNGATAVFALGANLSDTVGTVTLQGGGTISGSGTSTLTAGTGQTFEMQSGTVSARLGGAGIPLNKTTAGTVTLTGASTYTGATTVSAGALLIHSPGSLTSATTVNGTGTLGGSGAITAGVTIGSGGTLAPGAGIGTLAIGGLSLTSANSRFTLEIDLGLTPGADLASVTGGIALANSTLDLSLLNPSPLSLPQTFLFAANDGIDLVTGTFATLTGLPSGYAATVDYAFLGTDALGRIGTGNDIAVTIRDVSAIPEPGTAWMGLGCLAALGVRRRRRVAR